VQRTVFIRTERSRRACYRNGVDDLPSVARAPSAARPSWTATAGPAPGALVRQLRDDLDLRDVPLVVAVEPGRAGSWIPARDADEIIVQPLRIEELGVNVGYRCEP